MELRHLRYFVAVAESGSLSRAAEQLFIAQPPLSVQIRQLEEELGVPLLVRYPRGVRLTTAGTNFLRDARDLLARADRAKRTARNADDATGGQISIGYVPLAGHIVLPRLVRELRRLRPASEIDVTELTTQRQLELLDGKELDAGLLRASPSAATGLRATALEDPFCLAIPVGHELAGTGPIDLASTEAFPHVAFTRHRGQAFFDQTIALCMLAGFSPQIRYEASTLFGVLDLVSAGLGVALVPATSTLLDPESVVLRPLRKPGRVGTLSLVRRRDDPRPMMAALDDVTAGLFADIRRELDRRLLARSPGQRRGRAD